jgi:hypothetical protein
MSEPDPVTTTAPDDAGPPATGRDERSATRSVGTAKPATGSGGEPDPRCGYPKKDGSPCRNKVPEPGKVCRVHQKAALLDRILAGRRSASSDPA